jgi:hypothetical protein
VLHGRIGGCVVSTVHVRRSAVSRKKSGTAVASKQLYIQSRGMYRSPVQ